MSKKWPEYELRGLTSREIVGGKVISPIWHNVNFNEIVNFSPPLADKLAINTDSLSPLEAAIKIIEAMRPDIFTKIQRRLAYRQHMQDAEVQSIEISKIHPSPIQHTELSDELVGRIRFIRASLLHVYPHSMDFWLDGFKRDSHPSKEVSWWEHVATVFFEYTAMTSLNEEQYQAAYDSIFLLAMGLDESKIKSLALLPIDGLEKIINLFKHQLPPYDFEDPSPDASVKHSEKVIQAMQNYDREQFPKDLPDDLIKELLKLRNKNGGHSPI